MLPACKRTKSALPNRLSSDSSETGVTGSFLTNVCTTKTIDACDGEANTKKIEGCKIQFIKN